MAKIDVYTLGLRGVVLDKSDIHTTDGELLRAENWQVDGVGGRGGVRRRDGMAPFNTAPLAGPVLGGIGVPLADRSTLIRVFYLALNDGTHSFLVSDDGVAWSPTATFPTIPVREVTLGVAGLHMVYGDAAMIWRGIGGTLYYPGDDYANGGPTQPSVHAWNDQEDIAIARVPPNPADGGNTFGPFGVTSLLPYGATQLILAVADRTSGRARVLALDVKNGALSQLGAATDLATGHIIAGIVVWQSRVWIAGVNVGVGGALVTRWLRPGDATWTTDDTFGTVNGYCTGLCVFKGELYQGTAADAGAHGLIRRRRQAAGGSATRTTSVLGGSTSVALGGNTTVVGAVAAGAAAVPVADLSKFLLTVGAALVSGQGINYTGLLGATTAAPLAAPASGTGLPIGVFQYAFTSYTAVGESLPSARATARIEAIAPPTAAPIVGAAMVGGGMDNGSYDYALTFVTAAGETPVGPASGITGAGIVVVGVVAAPASAPAVGAAQVGGGMDAGSHDYVLTFLTATGETTPSPISGAVSVGPVTSGGVSPPSAPSAGTPVAGAGPEPGQHRYLATFLNATGETTAGNSSNAVTAAVTAPIAAPSTALSGVAEPGGAGSFLPNTTVSLLYTFMGSSGETTGSPSVSINTLSVASIIHLTNIPSGPPGTVARAIYHFVNGAYRYAGSYGPESTSGYLYSPAGAGAQPVPSSNTAVVPVAHHQIAVTVPTGPGGVIARRLYRSFNGGSFLLVGSLNDNGTTNFTDNVPNASRGGSPPTTNTTGTVTTYGQVQVSGLLIGDATVVSRNLYRRYNGGSFLLLANLNPTGSSFLDSYGNASLSGSAPPGSNTTGTPTNYRQVPLSGLPLGGPAVLGRNLYRRYYDGAGGISPFYLLANLATTGTTFLDASANAGLILISPPVTNNAFAYRVVLSGIAINPGAKGRVLYRTTANGAQLKLLQYLDNVSTTFLDFYDDSALLNVNAPTVDSSGLPKAGSLTGVTGLGVALVNGVAITPAIPVGSSTLPVADVTSLLVPGAVAVAGQTIYYTGRSVASGPGSLTGVTGIAAVIPHGAAVVLSVPGGASNLPIGDTTNFSPSGGNALVGAQPITYGGRTTTSGPGVLTGVAGLAAPAIVGTAVAVLVAPAAVWSTVYTSPGSGAGNSIGPFIVTSDGGRLLAFLNAVTPSLIVILGSPDGVIWSIDYNITTALDGTYGRSGMPLLDPDTGDIYWPLASGASGSGHGGLLKRSAKGAWTIVLRNLTNVRGPLGIVRVEGGE